MSEFNDSFDEAPDAEPSGTRVPSLADYWAIVVKHRRLDRACIVLAALVAGVLITVLSRPMYRAAVVLDVVRQTHQPLAHGATSVAGSGGEGTPSSSRARSS